MALERTSGVVSDVVGPDRHGAYTCRVGEAAAHFPGDLASLVKAGDELVIAGVCDDAGISVLSARRASSTDVKTVDASNSAIIACFALFVGIMSGLLGLQRTSGGGGAVMWGMLGLAVIALVYALWLLLTILRVHRAARAVVYG